MNILKSHIQASIVAIKCVPSDNAIQLKFLVLGAPGFGTRGQAEFPQVGHVPRAIADRHFHGTISHGRNGGFSFIQVIKQTLIT